MLLLIFSASSTVLFEIAEHLVESSDSIYASH